MDGGSWLICNSFNRLLASTGAKNPKIHSRDLPVFQYTHLACLLLRGMGLKTLLEWFSATSSVKWIYSGRNKEFLNPCIITVDWIPNPAVGGCPYYFGGLCWSRMPYDTIERFARIVQVSSVNCIMSTKNYAIHANFT